MVEICAAKIHHDENGEPPSEENNYTEPWEDATEVYAKPVGLKTSGGIDTFISDITFGFAGFIVEQRRNEESAMRYLRVIARRVNVPEDCVKHVEAFAGLLPARDAVPCRREQLPAFMQRLYELKMDEIYRNNSHFDRLSLKSGHAGGAEVWEHQLARRLKAVRASAKAKAFGRGGLRRARVNRSFGNVGDG